MRPPAGRSIQGARVGGHQPVHRPSHTRAGSGSPMGSSAMATAPSTSCCASRWTSVKRHHRYWPMPMCRRRRAHDPASRRSPPSHHLGARRDVARNRHYAMTAGDVRPKACRAPRSARQLLWPARSNAGGRPKWMVIALRWPGTEESPKGQGLDFVNVPDHAVHHLHVIDAATAKLLQSRHAGVPDWPHGHCRVALPCWCRGTVWFCGLLG